MTTERPHGGRPRYLQHLSEGSEPCAACRAAESAVKADYRRRRYLNHGPLMVDTTGARRRIMALAALGWPRAEIAARAGLHPNALTECLRWSRIHRQAHEAICRAYDELSMTPGPSVRARAIAARKGWLPPLAFDEDEIDDPAARPQTGSTVPSLDEVAVLRAMYGDPVRLRPSERAEATRRLTAAGLSAAQIAERLGVTKRSVVRQRNRSEEVA